MTSLQLDWDASKARLNSRKHGVSFEEARSVLSDDRARVIDDPDHCTDEERFILLGLSTNLRLLVVVHCLRAAGGVIHFISARKATREEQRCYPWR